MTERNSTMESSKSYFGSGKEVRENVGGTPVVFNTLAGGGRVQYTTAKPDGSKEFYLTDHLGSTREVYDLSTGNITYTSQYYPYGKQFSEYKSQAENTTEKFTSKEYEEGIDFNYHGARYYDPELGMWVSADAARQFHGQYAYGPDPINGTDPDGRDYYKIAQDGIGRIRIAEYDQGHHDALLRYQQGLAATTVFALAAGAGILAPELGGLVGGGLFSLATVTEGALWNGAGAMIGMGLWTSQQVMTSPTLFYMVNTSIDISSKAFSYASGYYHPDPMTTSFRSLLTLAYGTVNGNLQNSPIQTGVDLSSSIFSADATKTVK